MYKKSSLVLAVGFTLTLTFGLTFAARADTIQTYDLAWSGNSLGNGASATGVMTLDLTTLPNPTNGDVDISSDITSLSVTVTGSVAGNGTFTLADLFATQGTLFNTAGNNTLNMEGNVLTQLEAVGGDFNLFFAPPGPQGSAPLTLTTDGLSGDPMIMTEFSPVPEPGTLVLLGTGLIGLVGMARRKLWRSDRI